jgi:hypothetical protein
MAPTTTTTPVYNAYGQQIGTSPAKTRETTLERFNRIVDRKKERMMENATQKV